MHVENVPIDTIKPYKNNPRKNELAVEAVATSIKEYGFRQPIVVDKNNTIVVGHTRWKAAKMLGLTEVPVHVADSLTPKQCRAYRLADNKSNELALWDDEILKTELTEIGELYSGFTDDELNKLLGTDDDSSPLDDATEDNVDDVDDARPQFTPTTTPTQASKEYTDADVARAGAALNSQFTREDGLLEVTCPECGHDFMIKGTS